MKIFDKLFKRKRKKTKTEEPVPTRPGRELTVLVNCQFYSKSSVLPNIEQVVVTGILSDTKNVLSKLEELISKRVSKLQGMKGYKAMIVDVFDVTDDSEYVTRVNSRSANFKFTSALHFDITLPETK